MASREGGAGAAGAGVRPSLRVGRTREFRTGMDTELVAVDGGVSLHVLCGDRFEAAQLFRTGGLSVHMVRVEAHPVSMASCTVGDHQWMLARDALVARIAAGAFVFELPGFFYAVVVPPDAARKCATLADIFARFSAYHDLTTTAAEDGTDQRSMRGCQDVIDYSAFCNQFVCDTNLFACSRADDEASDLNPWVRAHDRIQRLKIATSSPAIRQPATAADAPPYDRARQMERAVRTSAVVKLLSRSLLAGVLQPSRHLTISLGGAGNNAASRAASAAAALPSKSVVSDLLDAIETNRAAAPRRDAHRGGATGWWGLNVEGVMLLLRVVQAVRGKKQQLAPAPGEKRPRDEGHDEIRGGGVIGGGGGGAVPFGGGAARRWCGGRPRKLGNTVGACGSS